MTEGQTYVGRRSASRSFYLLSLCGGVCLLDDNYYDPIGFARERDDISSHSHRQLSRPYH
jgi:hypothetical protein